MPFPFYKMTDFIDCVLKLCVEHHLDAVQADCSFRQRDWQPRVGVLLVLQGIKYSRFTFLFSV